jgi:signal transduction histidine kinase
MPSELTQLAHLPKLISRLFLILLFCLCQPKLQGQSMHIQQEQHNLPFIKDSIDLVNSLNRIGMLYRDKNADSCFYYGMKAKSLATRLHYQQGQTNADRVVALALFMRGLYKESLELFSKLLPVYKQQLDTVKVVQVLADMARVYTYTADPGKAKALYRLAIHTGERMKNDSMMSLIYLHYGYNRTMPNDSERYYLDRSYKIASRYKDARTLIGLLQIKAEKLLNKDHKQEALPLIRQALSQSRKEKLDLVEISSLGQYSTYFYYENKPDSSLKYIYLIYKLAQEKGYLYQEIGILKSLVTYAVMSGDKDKRIAAHSLLEAALVKENDNLKKFTGDYVKYNAIQDDNFRLGIINKDNRTRIWLLIVICSITIIAVLIMYRLYSVSRRLNRQISEQNSQMQKALTALEQSQADNTRMMQIVAHDLRNPIGGMFSIASIMLNDTERSGEDLEFLELIKTAGQNSLDLVSDLLRVHTKTEELKKEPLDLGQMLHYCVDLLRHKAEAKGQRIDLQTSAVIVPANREKLWRVVSNLIANAIKFSPTGGLIRVALQESASRVCITVEDHGIGIPQEIAPKIFDMFTDAKRAGTAGEQPFGLGLAISKQIIEAHGGDIWFESKPGNGTTFYVELPY